MLMMGVKQSALSMQGYLQKHMPHLEKDPVWQALRRWFHDNVTPFFLEEKLPSYQREEVGAYTRRLMLFMEDCHGGDNFDGMRGDAVSMVKKLEKKIAADDELIAQMRETLAIINSLISGEKIENKKCDEVVSKPEPKKQEPEVVSKPKSEDNALNIDNSTENKSDMLSDIDMLSNFLSNEEIDELIKIDAEILLINEKRISVNKNPYVSFRKLKDLLTMIQADFFFGHLINENEYRKKFTEAINQYKEYAKMIIRCDKKGESGETYISIGQDVGMSRDQLMCRHRDGAVPYFMKDNLMKSVEIKEDNISEFAYVLGVYFGKYGRFCGQKDELKKKLRGNIEIRDVNKSDNFDDHATSAYFNKHFISKLRVMINKVTNANLIGETYLKIHNLPLAMKILKETEFFTKIPAEYVSSQKSFISFLSGMFEVGQTDCYINGTDDCGTLLFFAHNLHEDAADDLIYLCSKIDIYPVVSEGKKYNGRLSFSDTWNVNKVLEYNIINSDIQPKMHDVLRRSSRVLKSNCMAPFTMVQKINDLKGRELQNSDIFKIISQQFHEVDTKDSTIKGIISGRFPASQKVQKISAKLEQVQTIGRMSRYVNINFDLDQRLSAEKISQGQNSESLQDLRLLIESILCFEKNLLIPTAIGSKFQQLVKKFLDDHKVVNPDFTNMIKKIAAEYGISLKDMEL